MLVGWDKIARELTPKTLLWRHFSVVDTSKWTPNPKVTLSDVDFKQTDRGSFMARIQFGGQWIAEPVVTSEFCGGRYKSRGLVLFLDEKPEDNWTTIEVTGVSAKGNAVFGKPGPLYGVEKFYKGAYCVITKNLNTDAEELFTIYKDRFVDPEYDETEYKRLFVWPHGFDGVMVFEL